MVNYVNIISTKTDLFSEHKAAFYLVIAAIGLVVAGLFGALFYGLYLQTRKNVKILYQCIALYTTHIFNEFSSH